MFESSPRSGYVPLLLAAAAGIAVVSADQGPKHNNIHAESIRPPYEVAEIAELPATGYQAFHSLPFEAYAVEAVMEDETVPVSADSIASLDMQLVLQQLTEAGQQAEAAAAAPQPTDEALEAVTTLSEPEPEPTEPVQAESSVVAVSPDASAVAEAPATTQPEAVVAPASPPAPEPTQGAGGLNWAALRDCEATGNYQAVSSGGTYRGAYQFDDDTWNANGGGQYAPSADQATPAQQDEIAGVLFSRRGDAPWPTCGYLLYT